MKRHLAHRRAGMTLGWVLAGTLVVGTAFAQGPDGPPPPFGGPGGGPPPQFGRRGGGPPPPPPPATLAEAPLALLNAKLGLTSAQSAKITQIQQDIRQQREAMRPRPEQREGPPPDRDAMQANRTKFRAVDDAANQKITAVLSADQRKSLPGVLSEIDALRADGIPPEVYGDLKLTAAQEKQMVAIGAAAVHSRQAMDRADAPGAPRDTQRQSRRQTDDKIAALLTAAQRQTLDKFRQDHPRRGPGGPGGPGGGPGFGGPPPPDGNGPPPDGMRPPPDDAGPPPDGN